MAGRMLCSEEEAIRRGFLGPVCARRRRILRETIQAFESAEPPIATISLRDRTSGDGEPLATDRKRNPGWT